MDVIRLALKHTTFHMVQLNNKFLTIGKVRLVTQLSFFFMAVGLLRGINTTLGFSEHSIRKDSMLSLQITD